MLQACIFRGERLPCASRLHLYIVRIMVAVQRSLRELPRGVSVYVHWPYCDTICSYCNFTKYRAPSVVDHSRMRECLTRELKSQLQHHSRVVSVYFGGGTPSLAPPSTIEAVLEAIGDKLIKDAEVSVEVNPSLSILPKLREFKVAGVNRLSVGVQTFDDGLLAALNRDHTSSSAKAILLEAQSLLPGQSSVDLIFGLPKQTLDGWKENLNTVLNYGCDHLSVYQLTVERGTQLANEVESGVVSLPHDDIVVDMYEMAIETFKDKGLHRYEVSNFARPGSESKHNMFYWFGGLYVGIGTGAHSRLKFQKDSGKLLCGSSPTGFVQTVNMLTPGTWMREVERNGCGVMLRRRMTQRERLEEVVATSLRTSFGLHKTVCQQYGVSLCTIVSGIKGLYPEYFDSKLLEADSDVLRASSRGLFVLDSILPNVIECVSTLSIPNIY